jgi:ABC-type dipeptide/oligopeptide/nickel transport system permease component
MVIGCVLGIALGIASAVWRNSPADLVARLLALFGISTPSFWLGLMLISVFSVQLAWLPAQGRFDARTEFDTVTGLYLIDALLHSDLGVLLRVLSYLVLPATVLGVFIAGVIARITRASVLDALEQPYVVVARAKGLRETAVIVGHGLRNALLPIVTLAGLQFGSLLGGAAITETVFAWPGLGRMLADAIFVKDYPQVQASVLLIAATYVVVNTAVDLLYAIIDPRVARQ